MGSIIFEDMTYSVRGALYSVYNEMGSGLPEKVYQECLVIEFSRRGIQFLTEPHIQLHFRDRLLTTSIRPDFICYGPIIVEIKAIMELEDRHLGQLLSYLRCTKLNLGLLVNFGTHPDLQIKRVLNTRKASPNIR